MSLETEKAKLYKELAEISEKLTPLRNEYNFITTDLPSKKIEYEKYIDGINSMKQEYQQEKQILSDYKNIEKSKIDSDILEYKKKKLEEIKILEDKYQEIEIAHKNILWLIDKDEKTLWSIRKELTDKQSELLSIQKKEIESKNKYDEYITKHNNLLIIDKNRKQELIKKENDIEKKEKQLRADTEKYESIYKETNERIKVMESMMFELTKKEEDIRKNKADIERREIKLQEKHNDIEKTHIESKEIMQQITEKELHINKTISDFQDEKYKFLVLMKQKEIKRSDIDKLDKEFNL